MATPYLQMIVDDVASTQDLARAELTELPQVVIASSQSQGRGRAGSTWENADRAAAVSVAWKTGDDERPLSLLAGVAALRSVDGGIQLKWPNDLMLGAMKVGGILVERSGGVTVVGMGLNLYWANPPEGAGAVADHDPGPDRYKEIGALWAAELLALVSESGWPMDEYIQNCSTLGQDIVWEPDGTGRAIGVTGTGALEVESGSGLVELVAGAVRHVRG